MKGEEDCNWFRCSHTIFESEKFKALTPSTRILFVTLCRLRNRFANSDGIFFRDDRTLAKDSGLSVKTVGKSRLKLNRSGYIRHNKGHSHMATVYQIVENNIVE